VGTIGSNSPSLLSDPSGFGCTASTDDGGNECEDHGHTEVFFDGVSEGGEKARFTILDVGDRDQ